LKDALKFRLKLLFAMMAVVCAVTSATLYLAEKNLRTRQQEMLATQFQNEVRSFLALQETRLAGINEKCKALSHSVRLQAALEESDVDDVYRNALTELRDILATSDTAGDDENGAIRASFVRVIDAQGSVLSPGDHTVGLTAEPALTQALESMGSILRSPGFQTSAFVALRQEHRLSALRQIVVTKILDWNGAQLGALVLGFPVKSLPTDGENPRAFITGVFFDRQLYLSGISAADRALITGSINHSLPQHGAANFEIDLHSGPHLLFYKALNPETQFAPAYEVCLFPLEESFRQAQALRWKIITLGAIVLALGCGASLLLVRGLAKPVDQIVAGSVENLTRRQQAEEDLRAANRELQNTLNELKATQRQVIQQERLSAIGQMASGIAHDFNNTLTPILGFSELLLKNEDVLRKPDQARRFLEMLHTSAGDAANVVNRLREFYRPIEGNTEWPAVDLAKIVQQAISLTEPKWKTQAQAHGINIDVVALIQARPIVSGEEPALREVLTNLIFNAVDAMPAGGRISIETASEGAHAVLRVRDNGSGMSEEVRQRCLEPFFSTKGERGTGLGLSMVYGIIERHRGQLEIQSSPGKGTSFLIRLPLAETSTDSPAASAAPAARPGKLKILVVDDDERVCEVVAEYLRADGHEVVLATSGRAAVEHARNTDFHVVFLDRAMPGLSGEQTADLLKQAHPNLPIILLTGFGALIEVSGVRPRAVDAVLGKPVTLTILRQTIDKLLDAA
jgi:signal transduction histidine kinase